MVPLTEGGADSEPRAAASDPSGSSPSVPLDANNSGAASAPPEPDPSKASRLDTRLTIAIWAVALLVVAFAGYFAYDVYVTQRADRLSSPALQVVDALQKQVDAKPNDPTLRSRLAEALGAASQFDEAKQELAVAIKLDPKYVGAYENLSLIELLQKDYAAAEVHLQKVLDLTATGDYQNVNQRREVAFFHLGEISLIKKRYDDAVGYFKAAIRIRKDASDSYVRLAQAYLGMGEKDSAEEQLKIALKFDPRFPEANYELGKLYLAGGDKVNAAWSFRAAIDGAPEIQEPKDALESLGTYDSWYQKAVAAFAAGETDGALDDIRIARAIQPESFDAALLHGKVLEKTGDLAGAIDAYSVAVKIKPEDKVAAEALSRVTKASQKKAKK